MIHPATGGSLTRSSGITLEDRDSHRMETCVDAGEGEMRTIEIRCIRA